MRLPKSWVVLSTNVWARHTPVTNSNIPKVTPATFMNFAKDGFIIGKTAVKTLKAVEKLVAAHVSAWTEPTTPEFLAFPRPHDRGYVENATCSQASIRRVAQIIPCAFDRHTHHRQPETKVYIIHGV